MELPKYENRLAVVPTLPKRVSTVVIPPCKN